MFELTFDLCGGGLVDIRVSDGDRSVLLQASNDTDVLGELARAMVHMLHYAENAEVVTLDPPAEYRWLFERHGHDGLSLAIVRHESLADLDPGGPKRVVFQGRGGMVDFVRQLVDAMTTISRTHGIAGYEALWESHDFPRKAYRELKRRIARTDRGLAGRSS